MYVFPRPYSFTPPPDPTNGPVRINAPQSTSSAVSSTSILVNRGTNVDNAASYTLQRAADNFFISNLTDLYTGTATGYTDTSRTAGTPYHYRWKANPASGYVESAWSNTVGMSGTVVNFDFTTNDTINGGDYTAGSLITVSAGTFQKTLTIQNLNNCAVLCYGTITDGDLPGGDGFYNVVSVGNSNNIVVKGFKTQNIGYHGGYINERNVNLTFEECTYQNCAQNVAFSKTGGDLIWDKTDTNVLSLGLSLVNCKFIDCNSIHLYLPGKIEDNGTITNLTKNVVFNSCTFTGGNPGNIVKCDGVLNYEISNNTIDSINLDLTNDNRLFFMTGSGNVIYNKVTNIQGHFVAFLAVSFGDDVLTCTCKYNVCDQSLKYSSFEYQTFASFVTAFTTYCNVDIWYNTMGGLNNEAHTEFPANICDWYGDLAWDTGTMSVRYNLLSQIGYDPTIPANTGSSQGSRFLNNNFPPPADVTGNIYVAYKIDAVDSDFNSKVPNVGAYWLAA